jgi:signal transduction protein with GAF and PtsI domain
MYYSGRPIFFPLSGSALVGPLSKYDIPQLSGIMWLVSKVRELEARLERCEQQLRLFQRVSRLMARDFSLEATLNEIIDLVQDFLQCDSCLLYLIEDDHLVLNASTEKSKRAVGKLSLKLSEGLTGWVARERRLLSITREAYNDPRFKFFEDLPEDRFEAFLSGPIISRGTVVGVINAQHRDAHVHTGADLETLSTLGEQIGCLLVLSRDKRTPAHLGAA